MLSKARRIVDASQVSAFEWKGESAFAPAPLPRMAAVEPHGAPVPAMDAQAILEQHQGHLAALEREAFAKGFAQGERAGGEAAAQRGEAMLRRLTETLEELTALRAQMIHQTERQMVQLALAVARRIVHREVSLDQDLLVAMARVALDRLSDSATVTVRLHPEEFNATAAARAEAWTGSNVMVAPDPRIPRGGCRIESDFGVVDTGIDAQLQELGRALLGDEEVKSHVTVG